MKDMTKKERRAAKADLRKKVRALMKDACKMAMERIDKLDNSGCGLVQDHNDNEQNWITPKSFVCALGREMEVQYGPFKDDRRNRAKIKTYFVHM